MWIYLLSLLILLSINITYFLDKLLFQFLSFLSRQHRNLHAAKHTCIYAKHASMIFISDKHWRNIFRREFSKFNITQILVGSNFVHLWTTSLKRIFSHNALGATQHYVWLPDSSVIYHKIWPEWIKYLITLWKRTWYTAMAVKNKH